MDTYGKEISQGEIKKGESNSSSVKIEELLYGQNHNMQVEPPSNQSEEDKEDSEAELEEEQVERELF